MKRELKSFFKKHAGQSFKPKEISRRLSIQDDHQYASLKAALHKLAEENYLIKAGKRYSLNVIPDSNKIVGILEVKESGFGFVIPENKNLNDIFIASRNIGPAFDGDKVEVLILPMQKGKNIEGQIIKVLKRKRTEYVGTLKKSKAFYYIKPDEPTLHRDIYVDQEKLKSAKIGEKVIVGNLLWDSSMHNPEAEIVEVIGEPKTKNSELISIAREFSLPYRFSENTLYEAEKISSQIDDKEIKMRADFRNKNVFTIDPEDAKDFDDALSIESLDNGNYLIGIHIADVSHYVNAKSSLDEEAQKRGNSVYLVGQVIPMLPEKLSNKLCSLVPHEDRLTYSVIVEMGARGKIVDYQIKKTIINSKRRFTYEEAQKIIETGNGDLSEDVLTLHKLAQVLRKKRMKEGSFDFHTSEVKFKLDENGKPVSAYIKEIRESNKLIEEFMLLANKIVASHIALPKKGIVKPFVYRIHDLPDEQKITEFARFVKSLGYSISLHSLKNASSFQVLLDQVKGKEEEAVINELAIRSMAKAIYSPQNIGHYGLGFKYYSHFTSPIRRYSDLIVHRLLYDYIERKNGQYYSLEDLEEICDHISGTERNALEAERFSVKIKHVEFLKDKVGEEFHAIISGIINFGIFVKITDILAEGLVRLRDMDDDFYVYDEKKYAIVGKRNKKMFRIGDKVTVKLVRVNEDKLEIDFFIV